jgi:hypothetical protein
MRTTQGRVVRFSTRKRTAVSLILMGLLAWSGIGCVSAGAPATLMADRETVAAVAPPAAGPVVVVTAPPPPPPNTVVTSSLVVLPAQASVTSGMARADPAPPSDRATGDQPLAAEPPRERPGLATAWGEERESEVQVVPFQRADAQPFAHTLLRYDDELGVRTLAGDGPYRDRTRQAAVFGGSVTVSVRLENGRALDVVHRGDQNFVVGEAGMRYAIVLENHSGHRFEAVATVDGLDVMNGKPGTVSNRGYLLDPYDSVEIDGFRESDDRVAAFRFGRVSDSYAAKTGSARNVGVIGVALFREAGDPWTPFFTNDEELRRRSTALPFPADPHVDDGDRRYASPPRW